MNGFEITLANIDALLSIDNGHIGFVSDVL